jgi:hypothetical protein
MVRYIFLRPLRPEIDGQDAALLLLQQLVGMEWNGMVCIFAQVLHNDVNCHWFYIFFVHFINYFAIILCPTIATTFVGVTTTAGWTLYLKPQVRIGLY